VRRGPGEPRFLHDPDLGGVLSGYPINLTRLFPTKFLQFP
jgi:hypothetical protein